MLRHCDICFKLETSRGAFGLTPALDIIRKDKDGSTALHFAAAKGHLEVFSYLVTRGANIHERNKLGHSSVDYLAEYFVSHPKEFSTKFVALAERYLELLDLVPMILTRFSSPNAVLDDANCFWKLLVGLKRLNDLRDIINGLVQLSHGLHLCWEKNELEKPELEEKIARVDKMLYNCVICECLNAESNLVLAFQDRVMRSRLQSWKPAVARAHIFVEGPLSLCFRNENVMSILGTRQMIIYVDKVFRSCLKTRETRPIYDFADMFQMRTNCANLRSCPAVQFILQGLSKSLLLVVIALLAIYRDIDEKGFTVFLIIFWVAQIAHEVGVLSRHSWQVSRYLSGLDGFFNVLDLLALGLVGGWIGLTWRYDNLDISYYHIFSFPEGTDTNFVEFSSPSHDFNNYLPSPVAKALLALSAVPAALGLMRYMTSMRALGPDLLVMVEMGGELGKFAVVLGFCMIGFAIVFYGLFPEMVSSAGVITNSSPSGGYHTFGRTMQVIFDAILGVHDFATFETEPYRAYGVVSMGLVKVLGQIILMNLVIARFSATHEAINAHAIERWSVMHARNVRQHLLIRESTPLSMLPPPLNLIPILLTPFHYALLLLGKMEIQRQLSDDYANAGDTPSTTVLSLCGTVSDMIIGLIWVVPCAVYEIFLCLRDIRLHASREVYLRCCVGAVVFFPFVFLAFLLFLLYEIFSARSMLVLRFGSPTELLYEQSRSKEHLESTKDVVEHSSHMKLKVTVLRVELQVHPRLCTPDGRVSLEIGTQRLVTPSVKCVKKVYSYTSMSDKSFILLLNGNNKDDKVVQISLLDTVGQCMGTCRESFENWVANGRFEGDVQLLDKKGAPIGKVFLAAKLTHFKCATAPDPYQWSSVNYNSRPSPDALTSTETTSVPSNVPMQVSVTVSAAEFAMRYARDADTSNISYFATVKLEDVVGTTAEVPSTIYRPVWEEALTLSLPSLDSIVASRARLEVRVFDSEDNLLGECSHFPSKWWGNKGLHMHGALDLFRDGLVVGHVFLTIQPVDEAVAVAVGSATKRHRHSKYRKSGNVDAQVTASLKQQSVDEEDDGQVFSRLTLLDGEKERIFHGVLDDDKFFEVKSPHAFEMRSEISRNLETYAHGDLAKEMQVLVDGIDDIQKSQDEVSARMRSIDALLTQVRTVRAGGIGRRVSETEASSEASPWDKSRIDGSLGLMEFSEIDQRNEGSS